MTSTEIEQDAMRTGVEGDEGTIAEWGSARVYSEFGLRRREGWTRLIPRAGRGSGQDFCSVRVWPDL